MPANYLQSLKTVSMKLSSLPRGRTVKSSNKDIVDTSILKIVNVNTGTYYSGYKGNYYSGITFSIQNNSNYFVKNINILVLFYNYKGELIAYANSLTKEEIPPRLAETVYVNKELYGYEVGRAIFRILDFDIVSKY
jgi:hypothetical protein